MEKIYVATYSPPWTEYSSIRSPRKAFREEAETEKYIEEEKAEERRISGDDSFVGDYEIDEIELI